MNLKFRYRFEAAHRFVSACSPPCQTPHGHTWYVTLKWRTEGTALGRDNMVAEFQKVKGTWKKFISETVDHSFLHNAEDPLLPHLREHIPGFRGLPFPGDPTTEMVAVLFLMKAQAIAAAEKLFPLVPYAIEIEETVVNAIELTTQSEVFQAAAPGLQARGWWSSAVVEERGFS